MRNGQAIFNGSLDHAAIIVENMFAHASTSINILTGRLNARVYGCDEVMEQAKLFLADPAHTVNILIEDMDALNDDHPFVREFWDNKNVRIRNLPKSASEQVTYHFLVMDDDSYRFEKDKGAPLAIAAFGDKVGAKNMQEIFALLWGFGADQVKPRTTQAV